MKSVCQIEEAEPDSTATSMSPEERFARIVAALKRSPQVTVGASKKGFGSSALCVGGRIFAMISSQSGFVVKLPRERVDALVAAGTGTRFEPARGRVMKEWVVVKPAADEDWLSLAREALKFVGAGTA
ncbi:MmcQ/YjbR family DNA-binding protein [Opitutus sp. GAS368]|uniref:MmcQ/YjbR family DNA-binding protein n=1 Tax=Opitutus sp. GAS368 TaxID=1882749 RepID=UPI0018D4D695|nr:MmcQ/YjbR family DNA-binding protein [Opitutus sp. GAS368]